MQPSINKLTERQRQCLRLLPQAGSAKAIGLKLGISDQTVEAHLKAARKILGVNDSLEAARLLAEHEGTPTHRVGNHPWVLPTEPPAGQQAFQRQGDAEPPGDTTLLLREQRSSFGAPLEPPQIRDWFIRRRGITGNRLTTGQRIVSIIVIAFGVAVGLALVIAVHLGLRHFLVDVSRFGG